MELGSRGATETAPMPFTVRQARVRAAQLRDELEVAESWQVTAAERALRFSEEWDALVDQAPNVIKAELQQLGDRIALESPTFKRLTRSD